MINFISIQHLNNLSTFCDYATAPFEAAYYNFKFSLEFDSIAEKINAIAQATLSQQNEEISCVLKTCHFFSHLIVGAILMIPILNYFIYIGLVCSIHEELVLVPEIPESEPEIKPVTIIAINLPVEEEIKDQELPLTDPTTLTPGLKKLISKESSPHGSSFNVHPLLRSQSGIMLPPSPLKNSHVRKDSNIGRMVATREAERLKHEQEKFDAINPVQDGKRGNRVSIKAFKMLENNVTSTFFRLFPNETKENQFIGLRKKIGEDFFKPQDNDNEYIQSHILFVPGYTPEMRFMYVESNLELLFKFLDARFQKLNREFYLCANYKNDMQNKIDAIPYINIIKIIFFYEPQAFEAELNRYTFTALEPIEGERMAIQVSAPHQKMEIVKIEGLVNRRIQNINTPIVLI